MFKKIISVLAASSFVLASKVAVADPFAFTWTDTLGLSSPPYVTGEILIVTVVVDNGGTDAISQTWTASDVVSVTYQMNSTPITTVFDGAGLTSVGGSLTAGSYVTDASGVLTAVPSGWGNFVAAMPVISTDDPLGSTDVRWVINGSNFVYQNNSAGPAAVARAANVAQNVTVGAWAGPTSLAPPPTPGPTTAAPIPTMSAYGLVLTALGLLVVAGRRLGRLNIRN